MSKMNVILSALVAALTWVVVPVHVRSAELLAQDWLQRADDYRLPNLDNRLRVSLTPSQGGEPGNEAQYIVWTMGEDRSRVEMLDPKVRGQRVLMSEEGMWLFIPTTRRAIRITPMQRLLGEASYGDLGRMVWHHDYQAEFSPTGKDTVVDGVPAHALVLTARRNTAVYTRVDLTVAAADGRPLSADFYLASGKLFKSAVFSPPQPMAGRSIVTKIRFIDRLDSQKQTLMELSDIQPNDLPEGAFTQAGLARD